MHADGFRELYHGTAASRIASIRKTGLFPQRPPRHPQWWAMLTSSKEDAEGNARRQPQGDQAVVTYWVPESLADDFLYPPIPMGPVTWYTLRRPLPDGMIHKVDVLEGSAALANSTVTSSLSGFLGHFSDQHLPPLALASIGRG